MGTELLRFAREHGITLVLFGKTRRSRWRRVYSLSPIDVFAREGTNRRLRDRDGGAPGTASGVLAR